MIKLINERDDIAKKYSAVNRIEMEIDSEATVSELLEAFREFMLASGYQINGMLDIVEDDNL